MNSIPSTQRKGRASLPLFYLLLAAALAPTLSFAQVAPAPAAAPAPVAGVVAAVPLPGLSGSDQVGPVILRDETIAQVLDLMQRWTGKSILRPNALPASVYTLSLPASITRDEALLAIETLLNLNGIAVIQQGDKLFSPVGTTTTSAQTVLKTGRITKSTTTQASSVSAMRSAAGLLGACLPRREAVPRGRNF